MKNAKYSVIAHNTHTGNCLLLPDTFETYAKCQQFVEKMNNKNHNNHIVYIATTDLSKFKSSAIKNLFAKAE